MKKMVKLALVVTLGFGISNLAQAITIDGTLSDWGLNTTWTPSNNANGNGSYTYGAYKIYYSVEDYTKLDSGQVWPGYGGQAYDAEALYVTWDAANLYIALVTGHNPATAQKPAANSYGAGDFALNFWSGSNNSSYEFGIKNTKTIGSSSASVYKTTNANWKTDPLWGTGKVTSLKDTPNAGTLKGTADLSIKVGPNNMGSNANRWIYELSVDRSLFSGLDDPKSKLNVSWTMNCANDVIESCLLYTSPSPRD